MKEYPLIKTRICKVDQPKDDSISSLRSFGRPKQDFNNQIIIGSMNISSINNKLESCLTIMSQYNIDYLQLQKTRTTKSTPVIYRKGYCITHNGPKDKLTDGCLDVMSISSFELSINIIYCNDNLSLQFVDQTDYRPLIVGSIYIPHKKVGIRKNIINSCTSTLLTLKRNNPSIPIIIGGDFNTHVEI